VRSRRVGGGVKLHFASSACVAAGASSISARDALLDLQMHESP
jgi:hypothetical protein